MRVVRPHPESVPPAEIAIGDPQTVEEPLAQSSSALRRASATTGSMGDMPWAGDGVRGSMSP